MAQPLPTADSASRPAVQLDAILNTVSLGIAISDEQDGARLNPVAANLLGLAAGVTDAASLAAAIGRLRAQCDTSRTLELDGVAHTEAGEYWILPAVSSTAKATRSAIRPMDTSGCSPMSPPCGKAASD